MCYRDRNIFFDFFEKKIEKKFALLNIFVVYLYQN